MIRLFALPLVLSLTLLFNACSTDPLSREDEIALMIDWTIEAAENRRASDFSELIDPNFLDVKGLNKSQLIKLVRLYFFRNKKIFLFTKLGEIEFPAENKAHVTVHVAMAGSPISGITALTSLRASIHRFDLELVKRDEWRLQSASWRPASLGDLN
ncbi:MAG: hypothetical protein ACI823_001113 [Chitinophagales bacterium]|jgi:hypothetical protein